MKKGLLSTILAACILLSGCGAVQPKETASEAFSPEQMNQALLGACESLPKSGTLHFDDGLEITGLGITYDGRPTTFDGCYYFPAIEAMTGAHVAIDWQEDAGYSSAVATTLLSGKDAMPDILNPTGFGVMDLADDGLIVPLDGYIDLMTDIAAAVGPSRMDAWRSADGHIYNIPSVSTIQGSFSMMLRQDWLDALGLSEPETW